MYIVVKTYKKGLPIFDFEGYDIKHFVMCSTITQGLPNLAGVEYVFGSAFGIRKPAVFRTKETANRAIIHYAKQLGYIDKHIPNHAFHHIKIVTVQEYLEESTMNTLGGDKDFYQYSAVLSKMGNDVYSD